MAKIEGKSLESELRQAQQMRLREISEEEKSKLAEASIETQKLQQHTVSEQNDTIQLRDALDQKVEKTARLSMHQILEKTFKVSVAMQNLDHDLHDTQERTINDSRRITHDLASSHRTKALAVFACVAGGAVINGFATRELEAFNKQQPNAGVAPSPVQATLKQNAYDPLAQVSSFISDHKKGILEIGKTAGTIASQGGPIVDSLFQAGIIKQQNELQIKQMESNTFTNAQKQVIETEGMLANSASRLMDANARTYDLKG